MEGPKWHTGTRGMTGRYFNHLPNNNWNWMSLSRSSFQNYVICVCCEVQNASSEKLTKAWEAFARSGLLWNQCYTVPWSVCKIAPRPLALGWMNLTRISVNCRRRSCINKCSWTNCQREKKMVVGSLPIHCCHFRSSTMQQFMQVHH